MSDNPVLNAQHVLFEAAKGYHWGLPYHAALASVTSAPAELLGLGQRLGKVKPGFDADLTLWDSDPLSVGAAPVQVWIDGVAQFADPVELKKDNIGPIQPDVSLAEIPDEPVHVDSVLFTGIAKVLLDLPEHKDAIATAESAGKPFSLAVTNGKVTCVGTCAAASSSTKTVALKNGHLHKGITAFGALGLVEISAEDSTNNGASSEGAFTRAIDGLALGGKVLDAAGKYGVTRAISAPSGSNGPHGVSTGFVTGASTSLEDGAVFAGDAAVHYTLDAAGRGKKSYSEVYGDLRRKLLAAATANSKGDNATDAFSESSYLQRVVAGDLVLALGISSADGIATALRIKSEVESASSVPLRLAIIGGAESHLVASELAAAKAGVILTPLQQLGSSWDARRALVGAPRDDGTVVDRLVAAGVAVGVGINEEWRVRDMAFDAGTAWRNGGGKISARDALDLVSTNVYRILGVEEPEEHAGAHFVVTEGDPLDIGSRIKAVGAGRGQVSLF